MRQGPTQEECTARAASKEGGTGRNRAKSQSPSLDWVSVLEYQSENQSPSDWECMVVLGGEKSKRTLKPSVFVTSRYCDKTPCPRRRIFKKFIWRVQFQRIRVHWGGIKTARGRRLEQQLRAHISSHNWKQKARGEWHEQLETSNPDASNTPPPTQPHLLTFP